jgi:hypothetical protein
MSGPKPPRSSKAGRRARHADEMTAHTRTSDPELLPDEGSPDDAVGYGKPPKSTRFKTGNQAARGRGRPRGSRNRLTIVKEVAAYTHDVTMPDGKSRKMTLWEAGIWKLSIAAARGDLKALNELTVLYDRFGIALPEAPVMAKPLTEDETSAFRQVVVDWLMDRPDEARILIDEVEKQLDEKSAGRLAQPGREAL